MWDDVCTHIVQGLAQQQYRQAVITGVEEIGEILDVFYDRQLVDRQNELRNAPIVLGWVLLVFFSF